MRRSIGQQIRNATGVRLGVFDQHRPVPLEELSLQIDPRVPDDAPQIALVTPSFNQADFVVRTVESVLSQNVPKLEYLVQDGKSTDDTLKVLERFSGHLTVYAEADLGQADAINKGFARTEAPIMGWLNSDDLLLPGALYHVARAFAANPDVDVVYGNRLLINQRDDVIGEWVLPYHDEVVMRHINYIPQETLFWRRTAWERAGGYIDSSLDFALDWEFILRLMKTGSRFRHLPMFLGAFRCHPSQKTSANFRTRGRQEIERVRQLYRGDTASSKQLAHVRFLMAHRSAHRTAWASLAKSVGR